MTLALCIAAAVSLLLAAVPATLFFVNLRAFRAPPHAAPAGSEAASPRVSVLIPARNEERGILACVESVLANRGIELEVIVLDDASDDRTAAVVESVARRDPRLRLARAPQLPDGWCGKQHACFVMSKMASGELLMFVDADVRLAPDAVARSVAFLRAGKPALVSGFPRQETGSVVERLLIPLIHFVLLGFLPIGRMRASTHPAYGAGCGQLFLARRDAYHVVGGHSAIRASLHDGVTLPRAFRRAGFHTDLFDATGVASCRMYGGAIETWRGLAKNATEGMASSGGIVPWTLVLGGGQVLPPILFLISLLALTRSRPLPAGAASQLWTAVCCSGCAVAIGYAVRLVAARQFRQSLVGASLHPLGVLTLLAIQWYALARRVGGSPATWRGRAYAAGPSAASADADATAGRCTDAVTRTDPAPPAG